MTDLVWPSGLFHCPDPVMMLEGNAASGGATVDGGIGQIVDTSGGGFWKVRMEGILLKGADTILAAEAWKALTDKGQRDFILPIRQARPQVASGSVPTRTVEASAFPALVTFNPASYTQLVTADITSGAALRATSVTITCTSSIRAGRFSIYDGAKWRTHEMVIKGAVSGNDQTFSIRPPLRNAVLSGDDVFLSYCYLHVRVEPGSFEIKYDKTTKRYAIMEVTMVEAR